MAYYEITLIQTIAHILTKKTRGIKHMKNDVNQFSQLTNQRSQFNKLTREAMYV